ncbi:hypothetical protein [Citricoccus muralis]|uniref:Uncharacterized protein n=1 Tax=Citricoccus muralis TaxID=169134 RepID=A0ABY8H4Q9_9MICC|nr:hypothetical protein [Citricoccus muralis]WFP16131.1 hypothetical protein P8192_12150 [Citricoccus muralis]
MPTRHGKPNYAVLGISTALLMTLAVVLSVSWGESALASVLAMVGALIARALMLSKLVASPERHLIATDELIS